MISVEIKILRGTDVLQTITKPLSVPRDGEIGFCWFPTHTDNFIVDPTERLILRGWRFSADVQPMDIYL